MIESMNKMRPSLLIFIGIIFIFLIGSASAQQGGPVAVAGGPYEVGVGDTLTLDGSGSYDPNGFPLEAYYWELNGDNMFDDAMGPVVTYSWDAPGTYSIILVVLDVWYMDGYDYATVTVTDGSIGGVGDPVLDTVPPTTAVTLSGQQGNAGWYVSNVEATLEANDDEGGTGVAGTEYSFDGSSWNPYEGPIAMEDEGATSLYYRSTDNSGNVEAANVATVEIDKNAPEISVSAENYGLYTIDTVLEFSATDSVSGVDAVTGELTDNEGSTQAVAPGHVLVPGVYTLVVTAIDVAGNTGVADPIFFVVYDPNGGFATGGGWFYTDEESTLPDGRANFGFVTKYKKGAATGNLEFQYKDADINLKSQTIDWLVISGSSAQFQGTATINGEGLYTFRVQVKDNGTPGAGVDHFDIRIWGGTDTSAGIYHKAKNTLDGGNIVVHKK